MSAALGDFQEYLGLERIDTHQRDSGITTGYHTSREIRFDLLEQEDRHVLACMHYLSYLARASLIGDISFHCIQVLSRS